MDYLFGLKTDKFVLLAADKNAARGISVLSSDVNKFYKLTSKCSMVCVGEGGAADQFANYIQKNVHLYKMRNDYEMTAQAAAHFARKTVADGLRSRDGSYLVHFLVGGIDGGAQSVKPYLTYVDYLGSKYDAPYVLHGYGGYFCYSILDRLYRNDMTEEEAVKALKTCLSTLKTRFVINFPEFDAVIIDQNGTRKLGNIKTSDL
uniref:Proteasome subunit beta n=1 Tax=Romanomermis culicivorax TaxID=13658 RepID=A0A915HMN1_ROMCU